MSAILREQPALHKPIPHFKLFFETVILDRPLMTALLLNLVLFTISLLLATPRWGTNDDPGMCLMAAGEVYGSAPDEHLLYINVVIGLLLKVLYGIAPHPPWYWLLMLGSMFASSVALSYVFLRKNPRSQTVMLLVVFLFAFPLHCVLIPQFTKTGFLAAHAGIVLIASTLGERHRLFGRFCGAFLLILGALIRWEAFQLAAAMTAPLVLYCLIAAQQRRLAWRQLIVWFGITAAIMYGLHGFNRAYYGKSPGWEEYFAYNAKRALFIDYGKIQYDNKTAPIFDKVGWKPIDLEMMQNWFFADRERYSLKNLSEIVAGYPHSLATVKGIVRNELMAEVNQPDPRCLIGTIILAFAFVSWRGFLWLVPLGTLGTALAGALLMFRVLYLPFHVLFPILGTVLTAAMFTTRLQPISWTFAGGNWQRPVRIFTLAVVGSGMVFVQMERIERSEGFRLYHAEMRSFLEKVNPKPDQLYFIWANALHFEDILHPWDDATSLRSFKCVHIASTMQTPIAWKQEAVFGIDDVYRAIFEQPNVFIFSVEQQNALFIEYVRLHYGVEVTFTAVHEGHVAQKMTVYRVAVQPSS